MNISTIKTAGYIAIALLVFALLWRAHHYEKKYIELQKEYTAYELKAEQEARATEKQWQHDLNAAVDKAKKWMEKYEAISARNQSLTKQLRSTTTNADIKLSTASGTTCAQYASTANTVLSECSEQLTEMARNADGHAADVRLLVEGWPHGR